VSKIKPFKALRPRADLAAKVSSAPYDVVYWSEVRDEAARNPQTFLRVTRPDGDFPEDGQPAAAELFLRARQNLDSLIEQGVYAVDPEPAVYVYRLTLGEQSQTGLVACCSIDEYESGLIKKHEKVRPDKVEDRTEHILTVGAQTGLIFLAFRGTDKTAGLFAAAVRDEPLYDFEGEDGVRHTLWRVTESGPWIDAFAELPELYVADGHHRAESAFLARTRMRERYPDYNGDEPFNYVFAGIFPADDLAIMAYNRVVTGLNGLSESEFFERLGESFVVSPSDHKEPAERGEICMYIGGKWYSMRSNVQYVREPDAIERLDVSVLQRYVLEPILGIRDVRTDERIGFVGGRRGTDELERMVDSGQATVAFSMFPTTMDDLFAVSDMGEIMPPKSTWFEPKLKDGLLVHMI
jgi:uncharacterized protein (DUF1015 family)